jgi:hypothetical protein
MPFGRTRTRSPIACSSAASVRAPGVTCASFHVLQTHVLPMQIRRTMPPAVMVARTAARTTRAPISPLAVMRVCSAVPMGIVVRPANNAARTQGAAIRTRRVVRMFRVVQPAARLAISATRPGDVVPRAIRSVHLAVAAVPLSGAVLSWVERPDTCCSNAAQCCRDIHGHGFCTGADSTCCGNTACAVNLLCCIEQDGTGICCPSSRPVCCTGAYAYGDCCPVNTECCPGLPPPGRQSNCCGPGGCCHDDLGGAFCCPPDHFCCPDDGLHSAACCAPDQQCCRGVDGSGFCCPASLACDPMFNRCIPP